MHRGGCVSFMGRRGGACVTCGRRYTNIGGPLGSTKKCIGAEGGAEKGARGRARGRRGPGQGSSRVRGRGLGSRRGTGGGAGGGAGAMGRGRCGVHVICRAPARCSPREYSACRSSARFVGRFQLTEQLGSQRWLGLRIQDRLAVQDRLAAGQARSRMARSRMARSTGWAWALRMARSRMARSKSLAWALRSAG